MAGIEICPVVLLTGAGFTKNFGGYVAREMLTEVRNKSSASLRAWIDSRPPGNFEALYDEALAAQDQELAEEMGSAVFAAFKGMDDEIRSRIRNRYNSSVRRPSVVFGAFLSQFAGDQHRSRAFWFTTNQDVFVERGWSSGSRQVNIHIPGLPNAHWFSSSADYDLTGRELLRVLPSSEVPHFELDGGKDPFDGVFNFVYFKLHGSINWHSHDGRESLVVGTRKSEQIKAEPLLNQYFEGFRSILFRPGMRLLIVGYGFGDPHINEVLCRAISEFGLTVFVANNTGYKGVKILLDEALLPDGTSAGSTILAGTRSIVSYPITDLYHDQYGISDIGKTLLHDLHILNY
ncbi:MAG: SIR2 family protein [Acidobacteria bacterium]|nr:SIR2 family protein [Acidobacteriota bacterium]